jgi:hypothetical protein
MNLLGEILLWVGCLICLFGEVKFLAVAYRRGLPWFFGCLFIPLAGLAFCFFNFRRTWKPAALSSIGFLIAVAGCRACGCCF